MAQLLNEVLNFWSGHRVGNIADLVLNRVRVFEIGPHTPSNFPHPGEEPLGYRAFLVFCGRDVRLMAAFNQYCSYSQ